MRASGSWLGLGLIAAFTAAAPAGAAAGPVLTTLYRFAVPTGIIPEGVLISDGSGALYGMTHGGGTNCNCGTVFKLIPPAAKGEAWTETVLYSFRPGTRAGVSDGEWPAAGVILDSTGALYGTTSLGGSTKCGPRGIGCGTVFKLTPAKDGTYTERVLHRFAGDATDGALPSGLVMDATGALYGTTDEGGSGRCPGGCGTVFKLTPAQDGTYTKSVLHRFTGGTTDGGRPSGLIMDSTGALYGTTLGGGTFDKGTVFKLTPALGGAYTETMLHSFAGAEGAGPRGGPIMDAAGALYGTTTSGGSEQCSGGCGTVFKLTPAKGGTYTESVLYRFTGGATDGAGPRAGLAFGTKGALYGTTYDGGRCPQRDEGCGTVFELVPAAGGKYIERVLYSFTGGADGDSPGAALFSPRTGEFFGTTKFGGTFGGGTVFEVKTE